MADRQRQQVPSETPPMLADRVLAKLRGLLFDVKSLAAIVVVVGVAGVMGFWLAQRRQEPQEEATLDRAFKKLEEGDFAAAKNIAVRLHRNQALPFDEQGAPLFMLGRAAMHQAEGEAFRRDQDRREKMYLIASRYLEEGIERGIPNDREREALEYLGKSLFRSRQYDRCIGVFETLLSLGPTDDQRGECHRSLAAAYYRIQQPDLAKALHFSDKHLAEASLSDEQRAEAKLLRGQILLDSGSLAECEQALDGIKSTPSLQDDLQIMRGRLLIRQADQAQGAPQTVDKYREAAQLFADLQQQTRKSDPAFAAAQYLAAVCRERMQDLQQAEQLFALARKRHLGTPVGIAAAMGEADVQRRQGKDDAAIVSYQRVLSEAGEPATYHNPWLPLKEFRDRIRSAFNDWLGSEKFPLAVRLAKAMWPMFPRVTAAEYLAQAHGAWAETLLTQAEDSADSSAGLIRQAREQFRNAGQTQSELASLRYATREYPDDLWQSAESYFKGHDYRNSVEMLNRYVDSSPGSRLARAKVMTGQAHLALDNLQQAKKALLDCIQFHPLDPDTYRARIIAAQVYLELDEVEEAKKLLLDNLENPDLKLRPESIEWRDSLLAYGKLLHREALLHEAASRKAGVDRSDNEETVKNGLKELEHAHQLFQEAIERLSEALQRYGEDDSIHDALLMARYLIADSHRQAAKWPRKRLPLVVIETTRARLNEQIQAELTAAADTYLNLEKELIKLKDHADLTDTQAAMLRNCYFGRGDALFDMGRYEAAIRAYSSATNHYRAESLEAFLQIASCYRRLGRHEEAQGTMEQAKVALANIPDEVDFTKTTRYDRQQWHDVLDWLTTL